AYSYDILSAENVRGRIAGARRLSLPLRLSIPVHPYADDISPTIASPSHHSPYTSPSVQWATPDTSRLSIPVQPYADEISPTITSPSHHSPSVQWATPDTSPAGSPISGVVDLTMSIKTLAYSPVTTGGFSDIYKAAWTRRNIDGKTVIVAVKLLRPFSIHDSATVRKKLNWEVYVWHRLEHPNIAKLFGMSYHMSGRPSMVMEWYENGNAAEFLRGPRGHEADRYSLARVLDVAQGLDYLHTQSSPIIHGDLKSNNVLINKDLRAVLSDFGLAQVIRSIQAQPTGLTPSNPELGPTRWQAPELHQDDTQPGLKTDVWGFGCTAYE
ncbi:hypothetical protein H0H93_006913, partial [Arthromyces matolae]